MPRLDGTSQNYFAALSQDLKRENLSPEQVAQISTAVAKLPQNARITSAEVDSIARRIGMEAPHKATLIFALLMHRYGSEMSAPLKAANGLQEGLAGMLEALLRHAHDPAVGGKVSEQLQEFFAGFAGPRAADEGSGVELFRGQPAINVQPGSEALTVNLNYNFLRLLDSQLTSDLAISDEAMRRGHAVDFGTFLEGGEGGWVFRPTKQGENQPSDIPLGRMGIQALEHLNLGLSAFITQRSQGRHPNPQEAIAVVRDVGIAGALLQESMELIGKKQDDLKSQRTDRERELRVALGNYRVAHIGRETVNALVAALLPEAAK